MMKKTVSVLNFDQTTAMYKSTWGLAQERDKQILTFLLNTGLKINEFVQLNVGEVFTGNRVRVGIRIWGGSGKLARKVPMNREAREAIAIILDYNRTHEFGIGPEDPVVVSRQRNRKDGSYRITSRQVQRIVKSLCEDAALGFKTTPQTLRHTFAKAALEQGKDLHDLQQLLGHRSIKTTRDLYGNV